MQPHSFLDIPGICLTIPGEFRPLAKKELLKIPVFRLDRSIAADKSVDRSSGESRKKSMDKLKGSSSKDCLFSFLSKNPKPHKRSLQPFKMGRSVIAIDNARTYLPMVVVGAGPLMPPGSLRMKPGKVKVRVAPEISNEWANIYDFRT
jgi:1-acyl-sn-glycerol-3-phosphate acyltransferase